MSRLSRIIGIAVVLLAAGAAASCGGEEAQQRSTEAFCQTVAAEQQRLGDKYEARFDGISAEGDPLAGLALSAASLVEVQGDLVVYFDRLEGVAPSEVQPEVAAVGQAFADQLDALKSGSLSGAIFGSLVSGLSVQGSLTTVNDFTVTNCGRSI